jgi:chromosome segregation ATPase
MKNTFKTTLEKFKSDLYNKTTRIVNLETNVDVNTRRMNHTRKKYKEKMNDIIRFVSEKKDTKKDLAQINARAEEIEHNYVGLLKYIESEFVHIKGPVKDLMI